jgi:acetylornithine deacetylase/succinyl-diaminopimelate desuccinylase-like protein
MSLPIDSAAGPLAGDVHDLLHRLVRTPSYPGVDRQEAAVVRHLAAFLDTHAIAYRVAEAAPGRPNLVAQVRGAAPGPHLLFCGHTDTVPPNVGAGAAEIDTREIDGVLYGRGSVDMKGAVAAMAGALVRLKPQISRGTVSLAAVADEEMQSLGTEALIASGFRADAAIVGEPTAGEIAIGHKGLEWLNVDFEGRTTHGGTPQAGINAIAAAAQFIHLVRTELVPELERRADPILGPPAINMGTIHGGDQPSTVAGHCRIQLDRRWVTTETVDEVFEDLERLLARVRDVFPGLRTAISRVPGGMATMVHGPVTIEPTHPIVAAARRALSDHGRTPVLTVFPAWTDASLLGREAGIPSIVWGPGELACAHSPEEHVALADVALAVDLYAATALHFTGGA